VNGEDRRRRVAFLLLVLAAVMAVASAAFAVTIGLTSAEVDQLGGTDRVEVLCPANPCQINRVKWVLTSSGSYGPYVVDQVRVDWQTRETSGASYTVCVTLFDDNDNAISGGCATQPASGSTANTIVNVSPDADPAQVKKVQIVIVQN
jgi:2,4-dienoyl-CoA reductase-like NADH-dependent reductase (Old Yellow Enzyme family)